MPTASAAKNFKETFFLGIISKQEEEFENKPSYMPLEIAITNI